MKDQEIENLPFPEGWIEVTVGDVSEKIQYGYTCSSCEEPIGPRFLRITDIQNGKVNWNHVPYCEIQEGKFPNFRLNPGDIVFARTGATAGKSFLIKDCPEAIFASYLIRIIPSNKIEGRYLQYYFQTQDYWRQISENIAGIAQPNCNATKLKELHLPLPPLEEQQRIVAKIEKLLVRVDATKERLDRVPAIMQQFRQSVLAAACSGRLTEDWREIGVIKEQIIDQEQRFINSIENRDTINRNFKKYPSFEDLKETYNHINIPSTWHIGNLNTLWNEDEVVKTGPFGAILKSKEFVTHGIPVLAVGNVKEGFLDLTDTHLDYITEIKAEELRSYRLKTGDIVFTRSGTIGRSSVIPENADGWMMSYHLLRVRVNNQYIYPQFLHYIFSGCIFTKEYILDSIIGTTRPGINTSILANMPIPIPTQLEQTEIIRRVDALFKYATRIESKIANTHEQIEEITQSILHQAFTGKLVPTRIESE